MTSRVAWPRQRYAIRRLSFCIGHSDWLRLQVGNKPSPPSPPFPQGPFKRFSHVPSVSSYFESPLPVVTVIITFLSLRLGLGLGGGRGEEEEEVGEGLLFFCCSG